MFVGACPFSSLTSLLVLIGVEACWFGEPVLCRGFLRGVCLFTEAPAVGEDADVQMVGGRRLGFVPECWLPAVYLDLDQQPHYNLS